jgi:hypothetical protein
MSNTKMSKVDQYPIPEDVRVASKTLTATFEKFAQSLQKGNKAQLIALVSNCWDDFFAKTKGTKIQFTRKLNDNVPSNLEDKDGKPGYRYHPTYNMVINATTRAKASQDPDSPKIAGHTSPDGSYHLYITEVRKRFTELGHDYTPQMIKNDLVSTGSLKDTVCTKMATWFGSVSKTVITSSPSTPVNAPITDAEQKEEEALIEEEMALEGWNDKLTPVDYINQHGMTAKHSIQAFDIVKKSPQAMQALATG